MELNIKAGDKALVTTNDWFLAPDGRDYKAVFGTVKAVRTAEATLGVKPNGKSTNWYLEIGNMTVAGCQILYAIKTDHCNPGKAKGWSTSAADGLKEYETPSRIFFSDVDA